MIYYWERGQEHFYMLFAYTKNVQGDLTPDQLRVLSRLVKQEFR